MAVSEGATTRLCYVEDNWAYFSNVPPTDVWGDDWNDAPHDCNAGTPYKREGQEITKVAFDGDLELVGCSNLGDGTGRWGYLSVQDINEGRAPWLVHVRYGCRPLEDDGRLRLGTQIPAGVTLDEFARLLAEVGGKVYRAVGS